MASAGEPLLTADTGAGLAEPRGVFRCPKCAAPLDPGAGGLPCPGCRETFEVDGGIPLLFWPNDWSGARKDVTAAVRVFYEETPFPNYDDFDSVTSLIEKARRGLYARLLDDFMDQYKHPHESRHTIAEVVDWRPAAGVTLVKTIPRTRPPFGNLAETERLFVPEPQGNAVERWEAEPSMVFSSSREGGFFIVTGRKE